MQLCEPPGTGFGVDTLSAAVDDRNVDRCGTRIVGSVVLDAGPGADVAPVVVVVVHHRSRRFVAPSDDSNNMTSNHPRCLFLSRGLDPSSMIRKSVFVSSYHAMPHRSYGETRFSHSCFCRGSCHQSLPSSSNYQGWSLFE